MMEAKALVSQPSENAEHGANREPVRIFTPTLERVNIALGLFFFVMTLVSVFIFGRAAPGPYMTTLAKVISGVFLMNLTHLTFTFALPLAVPEVRSWWKDERVFGLSLTRACLIVFLVPGIAYAWLHFTKHPFDKPFEKW